MVKKTKYNLKTVKEFWNENPMNYDWENKKTGLKEGTEGFFKRIDKDFFSAADFIEKNGRPFGKIIPFGWIRGKKVLEVGCGMGSVSQLMALAGAKVTSIDLTPRAVRNTNKRFEILRKKAKEKKIKGLFLEKCKAIEANAQELPFKNESFNFVLSWGVIHHAPETQKCLDEIYRVLKRGGITSGMVYHKNSIVYYGHYMLLRGVLMGKLLKYSPRELADRYSDGYQRGGCPKAEHFTKRKWKKMMVKAGFKKKKIRLFAAGQVTDVYPPGMRFLDKFVPRAVPYAVLYFWGWFLGWDKVGK
jgi:ubiquinone/menaquinone biosynthesis C-methylase UbiE